MEQRQKGCSPQVTDPAALSSDASHLICFIYHFTEQLSFHRAAWQPTAHAPTTVRSHRPWPPYKGLFLLPVDSALTQYLIRRGNQLNQPSYFACPHTTPTISPDFWIPLHLWNQDYKTSYGTQRPFPRYSAVGSRAAVGRYRRSHAAHSGAG